MKKYHLPLVAICMLLCLQFLQANGGKKNITELSVELCSGEDMTWDEYLDMRQCMQEEDNMLRQESPFIPFTVSSMNNTEGAWSSVVNLSLVPAAGAQLPDGRILLWSAKDKFSFGGANGRTWTTIFDPATNTAQEALIQNTNHDMFCPGINQLPDGRIMVTGGSNSEKTSVYDPDAGSWSNADDMNIARGYHSNVTLASGATFTIGGSWSGGTGNKDSEIWTEKSSWFEVPGLPAEAVTEGLQSTQFYGQDDYFAWLYVAPNGKLFHAGPNQRMHWIDPTGNGSYTFAGNRGNDQYSVNGTIVMYDVGKVLKTGGSNTFEDDTPSSSRCYSIDFNQDNVQVTQVSNMNFPRTYHNSVVLPTGEVVVIGGIPIADVFSDNNSVLVPEIWNPNTQNWTSLAPMVTPRNYHSVGLLLHDGRILLAGGGLCGGCNTNHPDAEIYSPPYLFNANGTLASRPSINSAPSSTDYNSSITVNVSGQVSSFAMIRSSAVTHSTNNDQRRIPISFSSQGGNQYSLSIPGRNILPPGDYMLFAMTSSGTPSIARVINVGDDINDCSPLNNPDLGGSGLTGNYFNNENFTAPVLERTDQNIDFDWGTGSPAPSIGADTYSVRWEGSIQVPRSGTYTFYTNTDDGVRLWVDGKLMVDKWIQQATTEWIGMIHLEPNVMYDIKMEYYEGAIEAVAQLSWSGPGINKIIIPSGNLFPMEGNTCDNQGGDTDNDGVCDNQDCEPNNPNLPTTPGATCNDNDPNTNNDVIQADGCTCQGTPDNGEPNCDDVVISGTGNLTISNITAPITILKVFDSGWQTVGQCSQTCSVTEVYNVPPGTYYVSIKFFTAGWQAICERTEFVTVTGGDPCAGQGGDSDGDGTCDNQDCEPNNASLPTTPGTACNDGNSNTINDVIQADGCACQGTPDNNPCQGQGGDSDGDGTCENQDCEPNNASLPTTPGTACNDGNSNTINDVIQADGCTCQGTPDNNPCQGQGGDSDGDGTCDNQDCEPNNASLPTTPGTACNDGNSNTINDVIQSDGCTCQGTPDNGEPDCEEAIITPGDGSISVSNLAAPIVLLKIFNSSWQTVLNCTNCNTTEVANNLTPGSYCVQVKYFTSSWSAICERLDCVTVTDGGGGGNLTLTCPNNITVTQSSPSGAVVNWNAPTASTDCSGGSSINQTGGLPSGSTFPVGATTVSFSATDNCSNSATCSFVVTVQEDSGGEMPTGYCSSRGSSPWQEWIKRVQFGSIDNSSGKNLYADNTDMSTNISPGQSYTITLEPGFSWQQYNEHWRVWIDFNRDGDFEDAGEKALEANSSQIVQGSISVPVTASNGPTRMRVAMNRGAYTGPCEAFSNGEVEDYRVNIGSNFGGHVGELLRSQTSHITDTKDFSFYPNPSNGVVNVNLSDFANKVVDVVIYNQLGQVVSQQVVDTETSTTTALDLEDLDKGLYMISVQVGGEAAMVKKLVIQ